MAYFTTYSGSLDSDSVILVLHYEGTGGSRSINVTCSGGTVSNPNRTDINTTCSDGSGYDCLNFSITGLSSGTTYTATAYFNGSRACTYSFTTTGSSSGGGDSGGDDEDDNQNASPPTLTVPGGTSSIGTLDPVEGTFSYGVLKFPFYVNLYNNSNPSGYYIKARYQCTFGNSGTTIYYGPQYPSNVTAKPSVTLYSWGDSDVYAYTRAGTSTVSYSENVGSFPTTEGTHTVSIPVKITLYYSSILNAPSGTNEVAYTNKVFYAKVRYTIQKQYDDFFWADGTTTISSGDIFTDKIDASTWLDLISKVNKLKGTNISTSGVQSGQKFTATHYNNVASALGVKTVSSGADCDASLFNALRNAYRSQAGLT